MTVNPKKHTAAGNRSALFAKLKARFKFKLRFKAFPESWEQLAMGCDCCNGQCCEFGHMTVLFSF